MHSDIMGYFLREDDLVVEPIVIEDDFAPVLQGAGLGVELDEESVAKYIVSQGIARS